MENTRFKRRSFIWVPLARDERGVTVVEFGILAPVFFLMLLGLIDLAQMGYAKSILNGAANDAARISSLEIANTDAADAVVEEMVRYIIPDAKVVTTRRSYFDFDDIARPELWNDSSNSNGICDNGESFTDENRNGQWDDDVASEDNGGANDIVLVTVKATYDPLFAFPIFGLNNNARTIEATSIRQNQPFADQIGEGSDGGTCS